MQAIGRDRSEPSPDSGPQASEPRVRLVRRYLRSFGLRDEHVVRAAAERVVQAVLAGSEAESSADLPRRLLRLSRRWVEEFVRDVHDPSPDWFWRTQTLLARFPRAFLETPVPSLGDLERKDAEAVPLLPDSVPCSMRQQEILGPLERATQALSDLLRQPVASLLADDSRLSR